MRFDTTAGRGGHALFRWKHRASHRCRDDEGSPRWHDDIAAHRARAPDLYGFHCRGLDPESPHRVGSEDDGRQRGFGHGMLDGCRGHGRFRRIVASGQRDYRRGDRAPWEMWEG